MIGHPWAPVLAAANSADLLHIPGLPPWHLLITGEAALLMMALLIAGLLILIAGFRFEKLGIVDHIRAFTVLLIGLVVMGAGLITPYLLIFALG